MSKLSVSVAGATGKLGSEIVSLILSSENYNLVDAVVSSSSNRIGCNVGNSNLRYVSKCSNKVDVIIDASNHKRLSESLSEAESSNSALLVLSTGHDLDSIRSIKPKIPFCYAPNTSYGVYLINEVVRVLSEKGKDFFSFHLTETHHSQKKDAPSGTAIAISNTAKQSGVDVEMQSIRGGTVPGEHELKMLGFHEEIILTHRAQSRALFAKGALVLAANLIKRSAGNYPSSVLFSS